MALQPVSSVDLSPPQRLSIPGPPFLFGACTVLVALAVASFIPECHRLAVKTCNVHKPGDSPRGTPLPGSDEDNEPLLQDSTV